LGREESLKRYYEHPNYCKHCGKVIDVLDNQRIADVKRKQFCSHSCAASFNNKSREKNPGAKVCPICGSTKDPKAKMCRTCYHKQISTKNKTLEYFIGDHKYLTSKCQEIRADARQTLEESDRVKECQYCHNPEFNDILEVHHIKGILTFDKSTKI
jgi:ribosomal protein L40E